MTVNFIFIVFGLCLFSTECGRVKRVIEGMKVECGTQPSVVSLRNSSSLQHLCGATILTPEYALTAAHCVHYEASQYILVLNNYFVQDSSPPTAEVLDVIPHHLYNRASRAHDIAILRMLLRLDDVTWLSANLLPNSAFGISGDCTIYGYGTKKAESSETTDNLHAGEVRIVSLDECTEALGPVAPENDDGMMCAVGDGIDACQGDSGSPLICDSKVQAVSSYGLYCGVRGMPGVYTSVGMHLPWIRDIVYNTNSIVPISPTIQE